MDQLIRHQLIRTFQAQENGATLPLDESLQWIDLGRQETAKLGKWPASMV
jgi:hypothetical protein